MNESAPFVVGVDGGGTGSRSLVLDLDGRECASAVGDPALVDPAHPLRAARSIAGVVADGVARAGGTLPVRALWAGLAGAGHPLSRGDVEKAVRSLRIARAVQVGMDVEAAHWDAFGQGPGVVLVVGTGSMAFGRDTLGREVRVGGWGSLLGEEGSGYWIGLQALRAMVRAADGRGETTGLSRLILESLGLSTPNDLVPWAASASKKAVAALAPLVLDAAAAGDTVGQAVRGQALEELRLFVARALDALQPEKAQIRVALVGGLVAPGSAFRELVSREVEKAGGDYLSKPILPVRGAAALALRMVEANTD